MIESLASSFRLLTVFLAAALLTGCGDSAPRPPGGNSAANSSEPASSNEKPAATSAAPPKPADPNAVDLRSLPKIEHAKFTVVTANRLEGTSNDTAAAIFEHYRGDLEKLGWKLTGAAVERPSHRRIGVSPAEQGRRLDLPFDRFLRQPQ